MKRTLRKTRGLSEKYVEVEEEENAGEEMRKVAEAENRRK